MPDFNVRSDSVNVEQIMEQIRARIREKRGVDYTEQQIRELAAVKLEKFLDPRGVRSDLLDQFRKAQPAYEPPELPNFAFEDATLFESHRAPIRWIRKLLMPLLKLLFNPNPLIQALNIQSRLNTMNAEREARREAARRQMDQLYYELVHNLVVETTRTGIEVKNLKMRVESISSRLEFNERRARALEERRRLQDRRRRTNRGRSGRPRRFRSRASSRRLARSSNSSRDTRRRSRRSAAPVPVTPPTQTALAPAPAVTEQLRPGPGQPACRAKARDNEAGDGGGGADAAAAERHRPSWALRVPRRPDRRTRRAPSNRSTRWTRWIAWTTTDRRIRRRCTTLQRNRSSRPESPRRITPRPRRNGHRSIERLSSRHTSNSRTWNRSRRRTATPPSAESAPVAAAETATVPPPTPDPADHDPQ